MLLKPENLPRVPFEGMNDVHLKELEILNKLHGNLSSGASAEEVEELLNTFIEDVKNHFSYEEELMEKTRFFAYPVHKAEHKRVLKELSELQNLWNAKRDREILKEYLERYFVPWLLEHVQTMDTATATYISNFFGLNLFKK